ncbi:unnamed protein product [Chrysoparadoxa australica]
MHLQRDVIVGSSPGITSSDDILWYILRQHPPEPTPCKASSNGELYEIDVDDCITCMARQMLCGCDVEGSPCTDVIALEVPPAFTPEELEAIEEETEEAEAEAEDEESSSGSEEESSEDSEEEARKERKRKATKKRRERRVRYSRSSDDGDEGGQWFRRLEEEVQDGTQVGFRIISLNASEQASVSDAFVSSADSNALFNLLNSIDSSISGMALDLVEVATVDVDCQPGSGPITSAESVTQCHRCEVGFYSISGEACKQCPEGADCRDVGVILPPALPGYWRSNPRSTETNSHGDLIFGYHLCLHRDACLGGIDSVCNTGYDGTGPRCAVCEMGYRETPEHQCIKCSGSSPLLGTVLWIVCLVVLLLGFTAWSIKDSNSRTELMLKSVKAGAAADSKPAPGTPSRPSVVKRRQKSYSSGMAVSPKPQVEQSTGSPADGEKVSSLLSIAIQREHSKKGKGTTGRMLILLSFVQVMAAFKQYPGVPWTPRFSGYLNLVDFGHLNLLNLPGMRAYCSNEVTYRTEFLVTIVVLPVATLVMWVMCIWADLFLKKTATTAVEVRQWFVHNSFCKLWVWITLILYPAIGSACIGMQSCDGLDGRLYLNRDYSLECNSSQYWSCLAVAMYGLVVYVACLPGALLYMLKTRRNTPRWSIRLSILFKQHNEEHWWYEPLDLLRKFSLVSLLWAGRGRHDAAPIACAIIICTITLMVHMRVSPYKQRINDLLQTGELTIVLFTAWSGLLLWANDKASFMDPAMFDGWLVSLSGCFTLIVIIVALLGLANDDPIKHHHDVKIINTLSNTISNKMHVRSKVFVTAPPGRGTNSLSPPTPTSSRTPSKGSGMVWEGRASISSSAQRVQPQAQVQAPALAPAPAQALAQAAAGASATPKSKSPRPQASKGVVGSIFAEP